MTKKHSSPKKNPALQATKIHFDETSQTEEFDQLMRASNIQSGIKPIKKSIQPSSPIPKSEPIVFDVSYNQKSATPSLINRDKFDGSPSPKKPKARQRKIKLSPGFRPESELDLHGFTKEEALLKVHEFLQQSLNEKLKTVLIITGRGLNSESKEGVLKQSVWNWLEINQTRFNIRFRWAPSFLGGNGAILIFWD